MGPDAWPRPRFHRRGRKREGEPQVPEARRRLLQVSQRKVNGTATMTQLPGDVGERSLTLGRLLPLPLGEASGTGDCPRAGWDEGRRQAVFSSRRPGCLQLLIVIASIGLLAS